MRETTLTVMGNVASEPVLRMTKGGARVVNFRLASTERRYDKALGGWRDGETVFLSVSCWRNTGDNVLSSVRKGDPVIVHGRLRQSVYDDNGVRRTAFEIEAQSLGHDLSRGVSRFTKASFNAGERDVIGEGLEVVRDAEDGRDDERVGALEREDPDRGAEVPRSA